VKLHNKEALFFDLDGTLVDSVPDLALAVNHMLTTLDRPNYPEDIVRVWVGNGARKLVERALEHSHERHEPVEATLIDEALDIFLDFYAKNLAVTTLCYPEVISTLKNLQSADYRMVVVTNKPYAFVEPLLEGLGLHDFFEYWIGGDSLSVKKPEPDPLLHVCDKLDLDINSCVMIGDSKNDILAAKAAGMHSIGVTYGYNYGECISTYEPDAVVQSFNELHHVLGA
jgi:phosphoglycolate phosphatase